MPNFNAWLGVTADVNSSRAEDAWRRIQQKPTSITIIRTATPSSSTTLDAQTVRLEYDNDANDVNSTGAGKSASRPLTVFGVKDHPVEPDTNIQRGDRFKVNSEVYIVTDVIFTSGEIQAKAQRAV